MVTSDSRFGQCVKIFAEVSFLSSATSTNSSLVQQTALKAAQAGREVLLHYFGKLEHIEEKFQAGLVSEADKESEKAIFKVIKEQFPEHETLGEESTSLDKIQRSPAQSPGRWIVDPLDGTTNYVHRFPIFCISIAYEEAGLIQNAVIDVPMLNEIYTAERGQGAWVNGKQMQVSQTQELSKSLLATGFFGDDERQLEEQLRMFSQLVRKARGIRRPGAAAYDLAQVARGVFDGFWERNLKPWDSAAGILLVEEAGGVVTTFKGLNYHPYLNSVVATNKALLPQVLDHTKVLSYLDTD